MTATEKVSDLFADPMLMHMPRLLSQVDRNPHSPTYGCCCRNHWHYRIEDIANAQMQEMVLTFALVWKWDHPHNPFYQSPMLLEWIEAILAFTLRIQRRNGCFDEVYRGQDSYAATAFVTFYISETVLQLGGNLTGSLRQALDTMLNRAAGWLARTEEHLAGNQVSGAAAAFMNLAALDPGRGYEEGLSDLLETLDTLQTDEGWFPEYGGADVGYASLTHTYLVLLAHRTKDARARRMADRSATFLQHVLHRDGTVGGIYGSRNTAYFIPVGAVLDRNANDPSARLYHFLLTHLDSGAHAVIAECLDDRYLAYLSPFYLLAAHAARGLQAGDATAPPTLTGAHHLKQAGLWCVEEADYKLIANLRKGGVFHLDMGENAFVDCGYFGDIPDGQVVTTQFLDPHTNINLEENRARITAHLVVNKPITISPWKNIAVRSFNLLVPALLRRRFLDFLRGRAVSAGESVGTVLREIVVTENAVEVTDHIKVDEPVLNLVLQLETERAFSFASTGFFEPQELYLDEGVIPIDLAGGPLTLRRRYTAEGMLVIE